jgi:DNA-binding response OmpR family regulator/two-component sensor histidine kinase
MITKKVLFVEDSKVQAKGIADSLKERNIEVDIAENGQDALQKYEKNPYPVVITDIEMPVMGGEELIRRLNANQFPPIIFVQTVHYEPEVIVHIMKNPIYDYLRKPLQIDDLVIKLNNAFELADLRRTKLLVEQEKIVKLENQLVWYKWKEKASSSMNIGKGKTIIDDMQRAFNQGIGTGALVTCLEMLTSGVTRNEHGYLIDGQIFEFVVETLSSAKLAMEMMSEINQIQLTAPIKKYLSFTEYYDFITDIVEKCRVFEKIKNNRIILGDFNLDHTQSLTIDTGQVGRAVKELILNALKYSIKESSIYIFIKILDKGITLYILNEPVNDSDGRKGIPMGYESIIFDPFFRLNKSVQEVYKTLDYGLGLTLVENIAVKHGGSIELSNVKDYSDLSRGDCEKVMATFTLPVMAEEQILKN